MSYELGIVIPVYRSTESVRRLIGRLEAAFMPDITIRICLVDDSGDARISQYLYTHCNRPEVTVLTLDRNRGQQAAILCGLSHMERCRYYATIDDDLQQQPEFLLELYRFARTGYDLAYGIPAGDGGGLCRGLGSRMRDLLFSSLLHTPEGIKVSSLRVIEGGLARKVCRRANHSFFYLSAAIFSQYGEWTDGGTDGDWGGDLGNAGSGRKLRVGNLYYHREKRYQGESGYSLPALARLYGNLLWYYGVKPRLARDGSWPGGAKPRPAHIGSQPRDIISWLPHGIKQRHRKPPAPLYRIRARRRAPRLMVLGGSNCQLHALKRTSLLGIDTVLADYTEAPPAAAFSGIHLRISTFDIPACIRAAKEYQVTGVMTLGTDQPVYTAACTASACGLPSLISVEGAFAVTNKKRMKQILSQNNIPTVRYRIIGEDAKESSLSGLVPPYVIKPLDSQGQRGIYRLGDPGGVLAHLPRTLSFSRCREALVEEYYESSEITVSGWVKGGRLFILTVTDRLLYPDSVHIGVCTGHRFPSVYMGRYEEIADLSGRIVRAFGLKNGPFYLQLLVGADGIMVNELASRIGGAFEDVFIPYITGFDILQAVIDSALGKEVALGPLEGYRADRSEKRTAVQLLFCRPGKIASATPLARLMDLPGVLDAGYNYHPGQTVPAMENATARFGHAVICGTAGTIGDRVEGFYKNLSVLDADGAELVQRFYPKQII